MNLNPIPPSSPSSACNPQSPTPTSIIKPHNLIQGVYISGGDGNVLYTKSLVPGQTPFYSDEVVTSVKDGDDGTVVEYREWNPYKSKLAAAILCGAQNIWIKPGSRVLVLFSRDDDRFGTTISHISDLVGPQGVVYVVDPHNRDTLANLADTRFNIVPIVQSHYPFKYRMLINMVDVLFAALDSQEQFDNAYLNAMYFLEAGGHYVSCVKASRGDAPFSCLRAGEERSQFQKMEHVSLDPFDRDHSYAIGGFRLDLDDPVSTGLIRFGRNLTKIGVMGSILLSMRSKRTCRHICCLNHHLDMLSSELIKSMTLKRNYKAIEKYINRFDKVFECIAYHPFESADEALMYLNAASNERGPGKSPTRSRAKLLQAKAPGMSQKKER